MTRINGIKFEGNNTFEGVVAKLKREGKYYKCRVCRKKNVKKEGDICETCRYLADKEL